MAETSIDIRTLRQGTLWSGVLTLDGPGMKAPLDLYVESDVKTLLGLRSLLGMGTNAAAQASATARANVVTMLVERAKFFIEKNPNALGGSSSWAIDALAALDKSRALVTTARGGSDASIKTIGSIFDRAVNGDKDSLRSARMITETVKLADTGRASFKAAIASNVSTGGVRQLRPRNRVGHDIATRRDLRELAARISGFGSDAPRRHNIPSEPLEAVRGGDPFSHTPYPMDQGSDFISNYRPSTAVY